MLAALIGAMAPTLLDRSRVQLWPVFGVDPRNRRAGGGAGYSGDRSRDSQEASGPDVGVGAVGSGSAVRPASVHLGCDRIAGWDWGLGACASTSRGAAPTGRIGGTVAQRRVCAVCPGLFAGAHALIMAGSRALTAGTAAELAAVVGLMLAAGAVISATLAKHARRARVIALHASAAQTTDRQPAVPPLRSAPSEQPNHPDKNRPS